jgi:hypothetical protein
MLKRSSITSAAAFLSERADFLHVGVVPGVNGFGYDVVLRIDGSYIDEEDAYAAAEELRNRIRRVSDIRPLFGWDAWDLPDRRRIPRRRRRSPSTSGGAR